MDRETRNAIERATRRARKLLEEDLSSQLEGMSLRDAALTTLTRFVALKMFEARGLVPECVGQGEQSTGYLEHCSTAAGSPSVPDGAGYRLYLESLFAGLASEVGVLFDRRPPAAIPWPTRQTVGELLALLNAPELGEVWGEDETIGWIYQFFSSGEERRRMRDESQAPRNSRELSVRNQFFTPRYVVELLTDNTLGRTWSRMRGGATALAERCAYLLPDEEAFAAREPGDPRDLRILDPACGAGHFLLYTFDLLVTIYEEAWNDGPAAAAAYSKSGNPLAKDYPTTGDLRRALPALILEHNLYGVEVDPWCARIAQLALWMRAQRCFTDLGVAQAERDRIRRTNIVIAEPMPGDADSQVAFARSLRPALLGDLFLDLVERMRLAGELGSLLKLEETDPRLVEVAASFARSAEEAGRARPRAFADDASQGVALLELLRERFDVVLMNPPFGAGSVIAKKAFERAYPRTKNDLYAAFVERGIQLLHKGGMLGAITSRTGFFLSSFQVWREEIVLGEALPFLFADLGVDVLDNAMVEVAAYCLGGDGGKTVVLRALEVEDKASALLAMIRAPEAALGKQRFEVDPASFAALPGSPFAYWASSPVRAIFRAFPPFATGKNTVKQGLASGDDLRFMRLWWGVDASRCGVGKTWITVSKGSDARPFYADLPLVLGYSRAEQAGIQQLGRFGRGATHYYLPGLTYALRASRFCPQVLPAGAITTVRGSGIYAFPDPAPFLALMNASVVDYLLKLMLGRGGHPQFDMGDIAQLPVPVLSAESRETLALLGIRAWTLRREMDTRNEVSHAFCGPALVQCPGATLAERAESWARRVSSTVAELADIQAEIDRLCFDHYGITEIDRRAITEGFGDTEGADDTAASNVEILAAELVSWAVGVAFGRFDVRIATGTRPSPPAPAPFDALPVCSPAMLVGDDGLPLLAVPVGYPLTVPEGGILVDDPGHPLDLTAAVRAVFEVVFGVYAEARWLEATALLDPGARDLRKWLSRGFFEHHLRCHSESRRKAPIFWQLATARAGYSVWIHAHRIGEDTLPRAQKELAARTALNQDQEVSALLDEVTRIAPLWRPDLDDGVVVTMAPLWRLVPQNRAWQRELKASWEGLAAGNFDWAHLAMHLWPERVVPKCAGDRSLAIAHGLEEVFWEEPAEGKWRARPEPTRAVAELVKERTSPAVKASLESLMEATSPFPPRSPRR